MSSLAETASSIVAEAREVADRVAHENRKYRRTRRAAALIVSEAINAPYSEQSLRKSDCPYLSVAGHVLYRDDDLMEHATEILAHAQKRGSSHKPRLDRCPTSHRDGLAARPNVEAGGQHVGFSAIADKLVTAGPPKKLKSDVSGPCLPTAEWNPTNDEAARSEAKS